MNNDKHCDICKGWYENVGYTRPDLGCPCKCHSTAPTGDGWMKGWAKIRDLGVEEKMSMFYDRVENFIRDTISRTRQETIDQILKELPPEEIEGSPEDVGRNEYRQEVRDLLLKHRAGEMK